MTMKPRIGDLVFFRNGGAIWAESPDSYETIGTTRRGEPHIVLEAWEREMRVLTPTGAVGLVAMRALEKYSK